MQFGSVLTIFLSSVLLVDASCPPGWLEFQSNCYHFSQDLLTWYQASYLCKAHLAKLATIETQDENNFLKTEAKARRGSFWVGGMDDIVEGDWRWMSDIDDVKFTFTDWGPHQPDNLGLNEDCLALYGPFQYAWDDASCAIKWHYICERSAALVSSGDQ